MSPDSSVDPRHLLLIGAGPGVGAAVARRFGREGFRATLISRGEGLDEVAAEVGGDGVHAASITIAGQVAPGGAFDPNNIAGLFWTAHTDERGERLTEHRFEPT